MIGFGPEGIFLLPIAWGLAKLVERRWDRQNAAEAEAGAEPRGDCWDDLPEKWKDDARVELPRRERVGLTREGSRWSS